MAPRWYLVSRRFPPKMHGLIAGWHLVYDAEVALESAPRLGDVAFLETVEEGL